GCGSSWRFDVQKFCTELRSFSVQFKQSSAANQRYNCHPRRASRASHAARGKGTQLSLLVRSSQSWVPFPFASLSRRSAGNDNEKEACGSDRASVTSQL